MGIGEVLSLTSIYLALVGLLSTFFFLNLTQWINSIRGLKLKWDILKTKDKLQYFDNRLECYKEANQFSSYWTFYTWLAITAFLIITFIFQFTLIMNQSDSNRDNLVCFVLVPTMIFLVIYLIFSLIILLSGYKSAKEIINEYKNG